MSNLLILEEKKDRAALEHCSAMIKVQNLRHQLNKAELDESMTHTKFLYAMEAYFTEKVRLHDEAKLTMKDVIDGKER